MNCGLDTARDKRLQSPEPRKMYELNYKTVNRLIKMMINFNCNEFRIQFTRILQNYFDIKARGTASKPPSALIDINKYD